MKAQIVALLVLGFSAVALGCKCPGTLKQSLAQTGEGEDTSFEAQLAKAKAEYEALLARIQSSDDADYQALVTSFNSEE